MGIENLWPALVGLALMVAGYLARWFHVRAVVTAEQRGRADEIEKQRAATELGIRVERAHAAKLEAEGRASAAAAEAGTTDLPVLLDEVEDWVKPPDRPQGGPGPGGPS